MATDEDKDWQTYAVAGDWKDYYTRIAEGVLADPPNNGTFDVHRFTADDLTNQLRIVPRYWRTVAAAFAIRNAIKRHRITIRGPFDPVTRRPPGGLPLIYELLDRRDESEE